MSGNRQPRLKQALVRRVGSAKLPHFQIFFVLMGVQVRLETFAQLSVLGTAAGLTIAAIAGKQVCGFGVLERGVSKLTVGIGNDPPW